MIWRVPLPRGAERPYRVWVNGVAADRGHGLHGRTATSSTSRSRSRRRRLSQGKWTAIFFGLWGSYGKNDSVDVQYRLAGRETLATGLEIVPPDRQP